MKSSFLLALALLGLAVPAGAEPVTRNDRVVKFCQSKLGEKVGDGECSSLADAALADAGAKPRARFKASPGQGDSVWGDLVYTLEAKASAQTEKAVPGMSVKPGDVVQLRDARFEGKGYFLVYPQHTAVVLEVNEREKTFTVAEQNVNVEKSVVKTVYRLSDLKTGWLRVYRPVAP